MKTDPHATPLPPRGAAVEVIVPEPPRWGPLVVGAGLIGLGVVLGSALQRQPAPPPAVLVAATPAPVPPPPIESALTPPIDVAPAAPGQARTDERPALQVMFAIDTTGSMGGVLRAAREKVWTIADQLLRVPGLRLELGLVAYRDAGDDYLTRTWPATSDLDAFYAALAGLTARGGGDEPEAVDAALEDALTRGLPGAAGPRTARAVVLVGDAPPHPGRVSRVHELIAQGAAQGVAVHSIYCGEDEGTAALFARLAATSGGIPARLDLHPQVVAVSTPHDEALARLQRALEATALPWGDERQQAALATKQALNARLGSEGWTSRASVNCKTGAGYQEDLLQALEDGRVARPEALGAGELPPALRGLTPAGLADELRSRLEQRRRLREAIAATVAARDAWLQQAPGASQDPLTRSVVRALLRQLEADGLLPSDMCVAESSGC